MTIRQSWCAVILCGCAAGCASPRPADRPIRPVSTGIDKPHASARFGVPTMVAQASYLTDAATGHQRSHAGLDASLFGGVEVLSPDALVEQVLARNPSLTQMTAAWQAASARYPQVTSLEDPMFTGGTGPGTFGSNNVNTAYTVQLSQKLPFPGKLGLRGENALAKANAAQSDVEDVRVQLIESARMAFFAYYLAERELEVNQDSLQLWQKAKEDAKSRYETGKADQQDVLQADVEIGRERNRRLALERMRQVAIARINTLMHVLPDSPLPRTPQEIAMLETLPPTQDLRAAAMARRPDLQATAERIKADEAALALAHKDFYPDVEVMAGYNAFWQEPQLRPQVGVRMNLPAYRGRRNAAVTEAQARIAQRHAELDKQIDQVNFQVQEAYENVRESENSVRLFRQTILPAAELNAKAARSAYVAGKISALSRIEAERHLVNLRDGYYVAVAEYFRRRATLERVIGGPLERLE